MENLRLRDLSPHQLQLHQRLVKLRQRLVKLHQGLVQLHQGHLCPRQLQPKLHQQLLQIRQRLIHLSQQLLQQQNPVGRSKAHDHSRWMNLEVVLLNYLEVSTQQHQILFSPKITSKSYLGF